MSESAVSLAVTDAQHCAAGEDFMRRLRDDARY